MSKFCGRTIFKLKNRFNTFRSFHRSIIGLQLKSSNEKSFVPPSPKNPIRRFNKIINSNARNYQKYKSFYLLTIGISGALAFYIYSNRKPVKPNDEIIDLPLFHNTVREDLPTFSMADVSRHGSNETGIWITYGIGVYDITTFVSEHPGGDKIMIGAGNSIDVFWNFYQQHNTPEILILLETFRIGNLLPNDQTGTKDLPDPWFHEPIRNAILKHTSLKPFNAEPPSSLLVEYFFTPNEFFYVRNHLPVPNINADDYELEIEIEDTNKTKTLTLKDIKSYPKYDIVSVVMCGGNRKSEMSKVKPVRGLSHNSGAIGNAVWSGPKLRDILLELGVESNENYHVHFEGLDMDPMSMPYSTSIPLVKAMDPRGDVVLAYEMNGEALPKDHGFPVRAVCPGIVGARNVKWLGRIVVSKTESDSHWQQNDYKGFSPSTDWDTVDFTKSPAIQNMPVTSAICSPSENDHVSINENGTLTVKGYAWSGGGNKIVRVDVTVDCGENWHVANLKHGPYEDGDDLNVYGRNWAWSLWTAEIPIPKNVKIVEIWSKAVDSNYNVQPETFKNIWNLRGMLSNAYSRIEVNIT